MSPRLLLVEDDEARSAMLMRSLSREHECTLARGADEALGRLAAGGWDAVIVDYDLGPGGTGLLVLQAIQLLSERTARLLYTSYYSSALAQDAERLVHVHVVLDARREEFLLDLDRALGRLFGQGGASLDGDALPAGDGAGAWCAHAPASLRLLEELLQAAGESGPVYAYGEPGAGKHLAAATLQRWRRERGEPAPGAGAPPPHGGAGERSHQVRVIRVPPLRERREDIAGLCERFFAGFAAHAGQPVKHLAARALSDVQGRAWWGNVRELHAALYRGAHASGARQEVTLGDLPHDIVTPDSAMQVAKHEGMLQAVLLHLRSAGTIRGAAALAGETRPNYKRRMNQLGILRADVAREPEEPEAE